MALSAEQKDLLDAIRSLNADVAKGKAKIKELKAKYDEITRIRTLEHKLGASSEEDKKALRDLLIKH